MSAWGGRPRTRRAGRGLVLGTMAAAVVSLLAVPAFGAISSQSGGVGNSGGAAASSGGNSATGNQSDNTATAATTGTITGALGNLLGVSLTLGAPQNASSGTAAVSTGPANAAGNSSAGAVNQANGSGGGRGSGNLQSGSVANSGQADANSGGNTAVGNGSTNVANQVQNVSGGLLGVGIVIGGPTNVSNGTATIETGEASASGNVSEGSVTQVNGGGGGHVPFGLGIGLGSGFCSRFSEQVADVSNNGSASANTGGNEAVGNASSNTATSETAGALSGDLLGLGDLLGVDVSLGGPTNQSDGSAAITTGAATAAGNESTGTVTQENCVPAAAHFGAPGRAPRFVRIGERHHGGVPLARTGLAAARLLPFAGLLLALGVLAVRIGPVPARRRNRN